MWAWALSRAHSRGVPLKYCPFVFGTNGLWLYLRKINFNISPSMNDDYQQLIRSTFSHFNVSRVFKFYWFKMVSINRWINKFKECAFEDGLVVEWHFSRLKVSSLSPIITWFSCSSVICLFHLLCNYAG